MFRFSPQRYGNDGWFRVGSVDVTTTTFIVGVAAISIVLTTINERAFYWPFSLNGYEVRSGELWRLVTWPVANGPSIWTVLSGFILFMVGNETEAAIGRKRMAWLFAILAVVPGLVGTIYAVGSPTAVADILNVQSGLSGIQYLTTSMLIVLVLRYPQARTFFNIPLWVLLAVFEAITALDIIRMRNWPLLVFFLSTLAVAALAARAFDLTGFHQIPKVPLPQVITGDPYQKANRAREKARRKEHKPSSGHKPHNPFARKEPADVIPLRPEPRPEARLSREAQAEMDRLLDKISDGGIDSLTAGERAQLDALSRQLRGE
ncbi:MAG: rhomboid family intramembrane serine protease [Actinobacteria bacterium]|nr:rhomboid family intramembrane serine protease [Actinomycetota bacterium]